MSSTDSKVGPFISSKYSAFGMLKFLGDEARSNLIQYMIAKDYPFSLILDGFSDSQNNHNLLVYSQTQEGTILILCRLIKLANG
jgi:hypothetical protein